MDQVELFRALPTTLRAISQRKLVQGVGTNDADYELSYTVNGKRVTCPYYRAWSRMLERGYSKALKKRRETYQGCWVCSSWLLFSNFKAWMQLQDWRGKHLDKDLLVPGNLEYGPTTCVFVTPAINGLLNKHLKDKGKYPTGVAWHKTKKRFRAQCSVRGVVIEIGSFSSAKQAHEAYVEFKVAVITEIANEPDNKYIKTALLKQAKEIQRCL